MTMWLPALHFAELADITERGAQKALRRATEGGPWNGVVLSARVVPGIGGAAGKTYAVALASLPEHLQLRYKSEFLSSDAERQTSEKAALTRDFRYAVIQPVLSLERRASGREALIRQISARLHVKPNGQRVRIPPSTVYRWLKRYEDGGVAALADCASPTKGKKRVLISRDWDRATMALPIDVRAEIASRLLDYMRGLHKNLESHRNIVVKASRDLLQWTRAAGADVTAADCAVKGDYVKKERKFRKVGQFRRDRKAFEDQRPHIHRAPPENPMEIVFGDVHHLDFVLPEIEGYSRYPKAVAWLDMATNRIWMDIHLLRKREGIRNEHVIESFMRMCAVWGAPKHLYLDNGSEYNWADFISDAMKLIRLDANAFGDMQVRPFDRSIVRARPYNAQAKTIEGAFGNLERNHFKPLPGWIGGNRQQKKTANLGKEPDPFPGDFAAFQQAIGDVLKNYHHREQVRHWGRLKGSPNDLYQRAIDRGWTRTMIDPAAFAVAFATEITRKVDGGCIWYEGEPWTCPALNQYVGDRVTALIPKYFSWNAIPLKDEDDRLIGFADRVTSRDALDRAGAAESHRIAQQHRKAVRDLARQAPDIDPIADNARHAAMLPADPVAPVGATVTASPEVQEIAAALAEPKTVRINRQRKAELEEQREARAIEDRWRKKVQEARKWAS